jgi:hypothetical protein
MFSEMEWVMSDSEKRIEVLDSLFDQAVINLKVELNGGSMDAAVISNSLQVIDRWFMVRESDRQYEFQCMSYDEAHRSTNV